MRGLFLDADEEAVSALRAARRPGDPEIVVRLGDAAPDALPGLLAGYDVVLNDHTPMPPRLCGAGARLHHVAFLGTVARS